MGAGAIVSAARAGGPARSSKYTLELSSRTSRRRLLALISATIAMTGVANTANTRSTRKSNIEAPGFTQPAQLYPSKVQGESFDSARFARGGVAAFVSLQIEPERRGFRGHDAAADGFDRRDHAAVAAEHPVGD
jgi:hypothetical protein